MAKFHDGRIFYRTINGRKIHPATAPQLRRRTRKVYATLITIYELFMKMSQEPLEVVIRSFGVSPWELEVAYGYFDSRFTVVQGEAEEDPDFISVMKIQIPLPFSEEFFNWFGFRRWEKIKALFKEMKRRRGSRKALKIEVDFLGNPNISFVAGASDKQLFDNAVEKIDFVLELLPYHLDSGKIPPNSSRVIYRYNETSRKWDIDEVVSRTDW